jgi:hypothetical protein
VAGFYQAFQNASYARCFFATQSGRIGIGPVDMRPEDIVAVLQGGYLPFILRPDKHQYEFLGPSYVNGIMCGEAVEEHERADMRITIFDIK